MDHRLNLLVFLLALFNYAAFLMSLNESRSGEMRIDFATFVSWLHVLTVMLISSIISMKIDVYVDMCTVRARISVLSPVKVVLLQAVRVRARYIRDDQLKVFSFLHCSTMGSCCWRLSQLQKG